eukprot:Em0005g1537a
MATQRKGKEEEKSETQEKASKSILDELKARRRQAKLQTLKKQAQSAPKKTNADTTKKPKSEANPTKKSAGSPPKKPSAEGSPKKPSVSPPKTPQSDDPSSKPSPAANSQASAVEDMDTPLLQRPIPPGDPDRPYIIELLAGEKFTRNGRYNEALERYNDVLKRFPQSSRAMYGKGLTLELQGKEKKSNKLTDMAIDFMSKVGFESFLAPMEFKESALLKLAEMAQARGKHSLLVRALEKLCELFPSDQWYANKLGVAYMNNQNAKKAKAHFQKVRRAFPENYFATAHLGLVLMMEGKHEKAVPLLLEGLQHDQEIKSNPKFYLYAGASLTALGNINEAYALYDVAVARGLLPSKMQRSIFNEPDLRAKPWWSEEESGSKEGLGRLLSNWGEIKNEALANIEGDRGTFGSAPYLSLFSMGKKNVENCKKVPKTCSYLETIPAMSGCTRGQVRLVSLQPKVHIAPYTATSNTQLHYILGLDLASPLILRSGEEKRSLEEGKAIISDTSFEQEVWYQSDRFGVILTGDIWHPDLTESRYTRLPKL